MRWSLSISAHYFTIQYKPVLKNQVPDTLLLWIDEGLQDNEVD